MEGEDPLCQEKSFVRDHFADAVHCLASLSAGEDEAQKLGRDKQFDGWRDLCVCVRVFLLSFHKSCHLSIPETS